MIVGATEIIINGKGSEAAECPLLRKGQIKRLDRRDTMGLAKIIEPV